MSTKSMELPTLPDRADGRRSNASQISLPEAMEEGVKLKMPVGLLGHATRSQKTLEELQAKGGVEAVVRGALQKFESDLRKLREACDVVEPVGEPQRVAKRAWMKRNIDGKEKYLEALKRVFEGEAPKLLVNDEDVDEQEERESLRSALSTQPSVQSSKASAVSRVARAEAAARIKGLELQMEHRHQQRRLEEQERRLRLQREDDELQMQLQQARLLEEALDQEGVSGGGSVREMPRAAREPLTLAPPPTYLPPVSTWAPRSRMEGPVTTTWAPPQPTMARPSPGDATAGLLQQVLLPKSKLPIFKGDPLEFLWFMNAFEMRVESITTDPARRLHLLIQHLEGDAKTLVLGCQLASPTVGYDRAKQKLMDKYGNKVRQALAFKQKLLSWPNIRREAPLELEKFSVQLQLCEDVKMAGGLGELDAAGTILQLMSKLPFKMQETWQMKAYKIECHQAREANFRDFCRFVSDTAAARNHPVYGHRAEAPTAGKKMVKALATMTEGGGDSEPSESGLTDGDKEATANAACVRPTGNTKPNAKELNKECLLCEGDHSTDKCPTASGMTIRERRSKLGGLCFACLKPGHTARQCPKKATCAKCQGSHPTVLHFEREPSDNGARDCKRGKEDDKQGGQTNIDEASPAGEATACTTATSSRVAVAVVPIQVWCAKKSTQCTINAILDPGSTATFVTESLTQRLGLPSDRGTLKLTTMTAQSKTMATRIVSGLKISGLDGNETITLPPAYMVKEMPYNGDDVAKEEDVQQWPNLANVPFTWCPEAAVEMLIGVNVPEALCPMQVVAGGGTNAPYAVRTALGWSLNGPLGGMKAEKVVTANFVKARQEVADWLQKLHLSDFDHVYDFDSKAPSQEDRQWECKARQSIKRVKEAGVARYQLDLPFRDERPPLKDNRRQALQRLTALRRKFTSNERFRNDYTTFMNKMESQGYVEEIPEEAQKPQDLVSYVPHHGVYHPRKPDKIRVVFNCSSKFGGISLNDCLLPGPDLTSSLVGVLLRFRQHKIAFIADIESMFYRVKVPEVQRNALRYLWWPGGDTNAQVRTYRLTVHLFGAASSPSCANYALRQSADDALAKELIDEDVCQAVKRNFYVDDCLKSMPTEKEAKRMAKGLMDACSHGGFRLTKFTSNSTALLQTIPSCERAPKLKEVCLEDKNDPLGALQERALGVMWDVVKDGFRITVDVPEKNHKAATKRGVLATLSAVYDPLGIAAPVIIVARVLFRNMTKEQTIGWDDELNDEVGVRRWYEWLDTLPTLQDVLVPRCLQHHGGAGGGWQLHVFCDASCDAYAAVAYLRREVIDEDAHIAFVTGKARVSPPKVVTIPRLELTAAKMATDLANMVQREMDFKIERRVFWTDSQTVLKYLANRVRRFHTFVANRVCSILNSSSVNEWRHVPSEQNPADEGSRGLTPLEWKEGKWLEGPAFLRKGEASWPPSVEMNGSVKADDPEVHTLGTKTVDPPLEPNFVEELAFRCSEFFSLKRSVCVWKAFLKYVGNNNEKPTREAMWSIKSLQDAEKCIVRATQIANWPQEWGKLHEQEDIRPKKKSELYKLGPKINEKGLLSITSRTRSDLPIVPGSTRVAELIVREAHAEQAHFGRQATAAHVLRHYWITGLNKLVRRVVRECPSCQKRTARPQMPRMAELPTFRSLPDMEQNNSHFRRAFETAGVDYFGPFLVKRGRTQVKAYGVIFTCASTRAIHLEVAEDLTTSAFLNALRRFVARRGHVQCLVSDNATNFVGADSAMDQELTKELRRQDKIRPELEKWLMRREIRWKFNPPNASHHGGFWERMIRSIRQALGAVLKYNRPLTYDGLVTVLCEVEAVLNNRPLTAVSNDVEDFEALTPNHLLLGKEGPVAPPGDYKRASIPLKKQWRQVQHVSTSFWRRWIADYRLLLLQRHKWHQDEGEPFQIHDVVLVMDSVKPREYWPLGRIVNVFPGKDNRVRVVAVQTLKGVIKRPVSKLCRLEAASESCRTDAE